MKPVNKSLLFLLLALFVFVVVPDALASTGSGGGLPYETWLESLRKSMTGPVAIIGSLVGIVASGLSLMFGGDMNGFMRTLLFLVLIMACTVGANNLLTGLFGAGAVIAQTPAVVWVV